DGVAGEDLAGFEGRERAVRQEIADVVSRDDRDCQGGNMVTLRDRLYPRRRGVRVRSAHVGDDADAALPRLGQYRLHTLVEARIESRASVRGLRLLRERDRPFRQTLEDEDVEIPALDQLDGRFDAIAGVSRSAPDPKRAPTHSGNTPNSTAATVMTIDAA